MAMIMVILGIPAVLNRSLTRAPPMRTPWPKVLESRKADRAHTRSTIRLFRFILPKCQTI